MGTVTPANDEPGRFLAADMLPPRATAGDSSSYSLPRGTCPSCESGDVAHLVIGMPTGPEEWGSGPAWVEWVGCVHPGHDRRCQSCGHTWTAADSSSLTFEDLASLMAHAEVDTFGDLEGWISAEYEHDAWVDTAGRDLEIGFGRRSVVLAFPMSEDDFWSALDEMHDEVSDELEQGQDNPRA